MPHAWGAVRNFKVGGTIMVIGPEDLDSSCPYLVSMAQRQQMKSGHEERAEDDEAHVIFYP